MHDLTVTAIGGDRPGIVAATTEVLFELGCNLSDCVMSLLGRQFAMILLVEAPDELARDHLQDALSDVGTMFNLVVSVRDVPRAQKARPSRPFLLSLHGKDQTGIVYRISKALASRGANITDLQSRVGEDSVYHVTLSVDLPEGVEPEQIEDELRPVVQQMNLDLTLAPAEPAAL